MSEARKPERNVWQIHLLTAIVLMLIVGAMSLHHVRRYQDFMRHADARAEEYPDPVLTVDVYRRAAMAKYDNELMRWVLLFDLPVLAAVTFCFEAVLRFRDKSKP